MNLWSVAFQNGDMAPGSGVCNTKHCMTVAIIQHLLLLTPASLNSDFNLDSKCKNSHFKL